MLHNSYLSTYHYTGGANCEWSIADVRVTGYPADVGGAPEDVIVMVVKNVLECWSCIDHVTRLGVKNTLRFSRRAAETRNELEI